MAAREIQTCPDCGASWDAIASCQTAFDEFLTLEFTDQGYGAVHFLTVTCFFIQHRRFSDRSLSHMQKALRAYLQEGLSAARLRQQSSAALQQGERDWKVLRQPQERVLPRIEWRMTIADVAASYHDAASYRRLVTEWAQATLDQMGAWER